MLYPDLGFTPRLGLTSNKGVLRLPGSVSTVLCVLANERERERKYGRSLPGSVTGLVLSSVSGFERNAFASRQSLAAMVTDLDGCARARSKLTGTVAKWWFAIREAHSLSHPPALWSLNAVQEQRMGAPPSAEDTRCTASRHAASRHAAA